MHKLSEIRATLTRPSISIGACSILTEPKKLQ